MRYEIVAPCESVLGGNVHLHLQSGGIAWHWGVSGHAVFRYKKLAEKLASAIKCFDWRGNPIGLAVVQQTNYRASRRTMRANERLAWAWLKELP